MLGAYIFNDQTIERGDSEFVVLEYSLEAAWEVMKKLHNDESGPFDPNEFVVIVKDIKPGLLAHMFYIE